uniref:Lecithin retinol acyltransferase n=1 Tax=Pithovirus LCPAC102 TaxID=2506587 RepID=A0A481Z2V6_9VIRU|nr:MAG: hypothetical protein LCPAC102_00470 [Pithovirus LCPAC102]
MGLGHTKEGNPFRDCIFRGLKDSGLTFTTRRLPNQNDLALVLRRFVMPTDFSYAVRSMYNGYLYHVGILYEGYVYNYMPALDKLLNCEMKDSINIDSLRCFKKEGDTEIYYITNTGLIRSQIIARLIQFVHIKSKNSTISDFNRIYGTGLGEYYNLFINNCEHVANAILTGHNFSCQEELVDPDIQYYWPLLLDYKKEMPLFAQIWVNEYEQVRII